MAQEMELSSSSSLAGCSLIFVKKYILHWVGLHLAPRPSPCSGGDQGVAVGAAPLSTEDTAAFFNTAERRTLLHGGDHDIAGVWRRRASLPGAKDTATFLDLECCHTGPRRSSWYLVACSSNSSMVRCSMSPMYNMTLLCFEMLR